MSTGIVPIESGPQTLSLLVTRVDQFAQAWDREPQPSLEPFLQDAGPLRRIVLVELIKVDLEFRWLQLKQPKFIEDYLAEFPELREPAIPAELIMEEMHVRQQAGLDECDRTMQERFGDAVDDFESTDIKRKSVASSSLRHRTQRPDHIQVGQQAGDFQLLAHLGQGAFANVFLASQASIGARKVALKVSGDFGTEPANLGQLEHDCIVAVHGVEVLPEHSVRLLCMEFVPGGTLHDLVQQVKSRPLAERTGALLVECIDQSLSNNNVGPPADETTRDLLAAADWTQVVCWIGIKLAKGLDYAHGVGVLHRDIKPANVLLSATCLPKLADFNTSFDSQDCTTTADAFFGGSLIYMSPEQLEACLPPWDAGRLDGRSDIYSLGVLLWELSTGQRPWVEQEVCTDWNATIHDMLARRRQPPVYEAELPPDARLPWPLFEVLRRCLDSNVDTRIASGHDLVRRLETCLEPNTRRLLYPPPDSWTHQCSRVAIVIMLVTALLPNGVLAAFNYIYNLTEVADDLDASQQLESLAKWVFNPVAFGIGAIGIVWILWPVISQRIGTDVGNMTNRKRRLCLRSGYSLAMLGMIEWSLAGLLYPVTLQLLSNSDPTIHDVTLHHYLHFISSHVLCGAIAAVYVYFLVTELSLKLLYPRLLLDELHIDQDKDALRRTQQTAVRYLLLAGVVPLVALMGMATVGSASTYMQVLSLAGVLGIALAFRSYQVIQRSTDGLLRIG